MGRVSWIDRNTKSQKRDVSENRTPSMIQSRTNFASCNIIQTQEIHVFIYLQKETRKEKQELDSLTLETMRWKVTSSSSILSFPFPNFLSSYYIHSLCQSISCHNKSCTQDDSYEENNKQGKKRTFRICKVCVLPNFSSCHRCPERFSEPLPKLCSSVNIVLAKREQKREKNLWLGLETREEDFQVFEVRCVFPFPKCDIAIVGKQGATKINATLKNCKWVEMISGKFLKLVPFV